MKKSNVKNILSLFVLGLAVIGLITGPAAQAANAGQVGSWSLSSTLPGVRTLSGTAVHNGRVYLMGGWQGSNGTDTVNYATINANGTLSSWTTSPNALPQNVRTNTGATYNGYLYSIGGLPDAGGRLDSVSYAAVQNDGSVGTWTTSPNTLPTTIQQAATFAYNGYLYVIGGHNGSAHDGIYYAPLANDGSIGTWSTNATILPSARADTQAVVYNGRVYLVGGMDTATLGTDTTQYATINPDHSIGMWSTSSNLLPAAKYGLNVVESNGYLYAIGGTNFIGGTTSVYQAQIKSNGDIGTWTTASNILPSGRKQGMSFSYNNYIYMIGGVDGSNNTVDTSYYAPITPASTSATVTNPVTSKPIVISTPTGTDLTCSSATSESSLSVQDTSNEFPVGLVSFCYTTNAPSNQITLTFVTNLSPSQVALRHFNPTTNTYNTVTGAAFSATTYGGEPAIQATYTIEDNGPYDTDSNIGSVSDPVGLVPVASASASAPNTGVNAQPLLVATVALISGIGIVAYETRKKIIARASQK